MNDINDNLKKMTECDDYEFNNHSTFFYFQFGCSYRKSADMLRETLLDHYADEHRYPCYYLYCHAAELYLKCILISNDIPPEDFKSHNLEKHIKTINNISSFLIEGDLEKGLIYMNTLINQEQFLKYPSNTYYKLANLAHIQKVVDEIEKYTIQLVQNCGVRVIP